MGTYLILIRSCDSEYTCTNWSSLLNSGNIWGIEKEGVKLIPEDLNADYSWGVTRTSRDSIVCDSECHLNGVHLSLGKHSGDSDQTSVKVHVEEVLQSSWCD